MLTTVISLQTALVLGGLALRSVVRGPHVSVWVCGGSLLYRGGSSMLGYCSPESLVFLGSNPGLIGMLLGTKHRHRRMLSGFVLRFVDKGLKRVLLSVGAVILMLQQPVLIWTGNLTVMTGSHMGVAGGVSHRVLYGADRGSSLPWLFQVGHCPSRLSFAASGRLLVTLAGCAASSGLAGLLCLLAFLGGLFGNGCSSGSSCRRRLSCS